MITSPKVFGNNRHIMYTRDALLGSHELPPRWQHHRCSVTAVVATVLPVWWQWTGRQIEGMVLCLRFLIIRHFLRRQLESRHHCVRRIVGLCWGRVWHGWRQERVRGETRCVRPARWHHHLWRQRVTEIVAGRTSHVTSGITLCCHGNVAVHVSYQSLRIVSMDLHVFA